MSEKVTVEKAFLQNVVDQLNTATEKNLRLWLQFELLEAENAKLKDQNATLTTQVADLEAHIIRREDGSIWSCNCHFCQGQGTECVCGCGADQDDEDEE